MRITGGRSRGIQLASGGRDDVRPATDRMREAVFSSLGDRVLDAHFLDLFAGTGAYGLEALSRGAQGGTFVELERKTAAAIHQNLQAVTKAFGGDPRCCRIEQRDVLNWKPLPNALYDVIFIDPPYSLLPGKASAMLDTAIQCLAPGGCIMLETPGEIEITHPALELLRRLGKGTRQPTANIYARREEGTEEA